MGNHYEKGIRIFPKAGDIIFFNPIGKRKNSHFDHVALGTGKKITRTKACLEFARMKKKCRHNNVICDELQKNIRFSEEYKKIRPNNESLEGGDRQVFFTTAPWIK